MAKESRLTSPSEDSMLATVISFDYQKSQSALLPILIVKTDHQQREERVSYGQSR
ncbi:MAG: hypothetical protein MAG451_02690 [Anaerolineales bacterium]|nr:hypothetical protein [Anaerolineales bacterium]